MSDLGFLVGEVHAELLIRLNEERVVNSISELAKVPIDRFGIAVAAVDGAMFTTGDAVVPFSIQSSSKLFTLSRG